MEEAFPGLGWIELFVCELLEAGKCLKYNVEFSNIIVPNLAGILKLNEKLIKCDYFRGKCLYMELFINFFFLRVTWRGLEVEPIST